MGSVTVTIKPLSDFGTALRRSRRILAERLGAVSKPLNIVGPNLAAPIVYGRALVNGRLVFANRPADTVVTHMVMVYAAHEIEAFDDVLYSGRTMTRDGNGRVAETDQAFGWIDVFEHLGADAQTADQTLINEVGTSYWTTAHRLRGLAYIYFQTALTAVKFVTEKPEAFQAVIKGAKIFDTRTSTTIYSTNPALCIRDYLTNTRYGLGQPTADMNDASFTQAANDCDTQGFTVNGVIPTDIGPLDVLERLIDAMGGTLQRVHGKWTVKAGIWEASSVTLGEDVLIDGGEPRIVPKVPGANLVNGMRGTFIEPARVWQETDIPAIINATFVTEDAGFEHLGDKSLSMVTVVNQAQHLLSIELLRGRQQVTVSAGFKLAALQLRAGDVMALDYTRNGVTWTAKTFVVETLAVEMQGTAFVVTMDLREIEAAVFTAPSFTSLPTLTKIVIFIREKEEDEELRVAGLELINATELNGVEFTDPDAQFAWRLVSVGESYEFGSEPAGAGSGAYSRDFRDFHIRILDSDGVTLRRELYSTGETFDYTLEMNQKDGIGTPATDFEIEVTLRTFSGDRDAPPVRHSASNPELGRDDFDPIDEVSGNDEWDVGARPKRIIRLTANTTLGASKNLKEGATYILYVIQGGTFTLAYNSLFKWPGGTAPTITATAGAIDIITFVVRGGLIWGVHQGDFK